MCINTCQSSKAPGYKLSATDVQQKAACYEKERKIIKMDN